MALIEDLTGTQGMSAIVAMFTLVVPLAIAIAAWCKRRYARSVVALQASSAEGADATDGEDAPRPALPPPLPIVVQSAAEVVDNRLTAAAQRLRRRVLGVQFAAGQLYWWTLWLALVVSALIAASSPPARLAPAEAPAADPPTAASLVLLLPFLLLPPLVAPALQAGWRERSVWALIGIGLGIGAVSSGFARLGWQSVGYFLLVSMLYLAIHAAFLRPAVRGAGPPLIAALVVGWLVLTVLTAIGIAVKERLGEDATGTLLGWASSLGALLAILAVSGWATWRTLLRLARRYEARRFSELQLALGTYWGLITLSIAATVLAQSYEARTGGIMERIALFVLLAWCLWRLVQRAGLWWAVRRAPPPLAPLLLLRVFKPSNRSEAFIDRFLARWRFAAPCWMIAGPDLAGAYMEPDEFFAWLRRRLAERFIRRAGQIAPTLDALDATRDPDGRFRVFEMFCTNTTWKPTVLAMIERAGVVLLDLREYHERRAGARYELRELLRRAPLERVLMLTDEPSDAPKLRAAIEADWREVGHAAPQPLRLMCVATGSRAEIDGLFCAAVQAAAATT